MSCWVLVASLRSSSARCLSACFSWSLKCTEVNKFVFSFLALFSEARKQCKSDVPYTLLMKCQSFYPECDWAPWWLCTEWLGEPEASLSYSPQGLGSFPMTTESMADCESSLDWCLLLFLLCVWVYVTFDNCMSTASYNPQSETLIKGVRSCEVILSLPWVPVHLPVLNCWSLKSLSRGPTGVPLPTYSSIQT